MISKLHVAIITQAHSLRETLTNYELNAPVLRTIGVGEPKNQALSPVFGLGFLLFGLP